MKNTEQIINIIKEQGIIPLFYHDDVDVSIAVVNALYNAGIRVVEYTNRGSRSIDNFKAVIETRDKRWADLILSVGTIKNIELKGASNVEVTLSIEKKAAPYIKRDAMAKIGSEGFLGNKIVIIYGGTAGTAAASARRANRR